jgi:hypothetical protein
MDHASIINFLSNAEPRSLLLGSSFTGGKYDKIQRGGKSEAA